MSDLNSVILSTNFDTISQLYNYTIKSEGMRVQYYNKWSNPIYDKLEFTSIDILKINQCFGN